MTLRQQDPTVGEDWLKTIVWDLPPRTWAEFVAWADPDGRGHGIVESLASPSWHAAPEAIVDGLKAWLAAHDMVAMLPPFLRDDAPDGVRPGLRASAFEYNPDQERDEQGRWTSGGGGGEIGDYPGLGVPVASMAGFEGMTSGRGKNEIPMTEAITRACERHFDDGSGRPIDEQIVDRYQGYMDRARDTEAWQQGVEWYANAHDAAAGQAEAYDKDLGAVVGAYAAISPGLEWGLEEGIIGTMLEYEATGTVNLDQDRLDCLNAKMDGYGFDRIENGQRFSDLDGKAAVVAMHDQFMSQPLQSGGRDQGWPARYGYDNYVKGLDLLRGNKTPDEALVGVKVRSFYDSIANPANPDQVCIDVMMMRAAGGGPTFQNDSSVTGQPGKTIDGVKTDIGPTPLLADAVRTVAEREGVTPNEAQAIIWTQWKAETGQEA